MKVLLLIWIFVSGYDVGGPPVEVDTVEQCRDLAMQFVTGPAPEGASAHGAGCIVVNRDEKI